MRKFSRELVNWGVQFCTPLLLLMLLVVVTSLARARPAQAAEEEFKAFCWDTRDELVEHLQKDTDNNGVKYSHYKCVINTKSSSMYVEGRRNPINLKARCGTLKNGKPDESTPYRYWFWIKSNKLKVSSAHWSTGYFKATMKPLTYSYNTNQYSGVRTDRLVAKAGHGFVKSYGVSSCGRGVEIYVVDLKDWFDQKYDELADNFSGYVYMQSITYTYNSQGHRDGPYRTLASWTAASRGLGFGESGISDYKYHYNQKIPINKSITHRLRIYRMHTSKAGTEHAVGGRITGKGEVAESCKFTDKNGKKISGKLYDKKITAGSIIQFARGKDCNIGKYTYGGKTYYLKGIREVHIDNKTKDAVEYAKFSMLDDLRKTPLAGTDTKTTNYTQVDGKADKEDTISKRDLSYRVQFKFTLKKNKFSVKRVKKLKSPKSVRAGNKKGLKGKKAWKDIVDYMKGLTWKNGIQENRIYLIYQEKPEKNIKVYNRMFQYSDKESKYQVVSGGTSPVYTQKIKSGDSKISIDLTKIQKQSVSAKKPDKKGCAATYKTGGDGNYFAKNVKIKYVNKSGDEVEKTFSIGDYYYNSSNGNVGKAGSSFAETDTKKTYSINTGHKDTEKALTAIVQHLYEQVSLTANTTDDVEIYVDYYQPKVPSVALIYRRSYDDDGKAVDTLVTTQKLGNFNINSTTAEKKCLGSYGPYTTTMSFTKDSDGKWTIATGKESTTSSAATDEEGVETLSLVEEKVYKADVENYHGATSSSWSGNGLMGKLKNN